jgi:hypothetical protein
LVSTRDEASAAPDLGRAQDAGMPRQGTDHGTAVTGRDTIETADAI